MKLKLGNFWFFVLINLSVFGQVNIKMMSYNLLHYPTGISIDRKDNLRYVLNAYQPDILAVCELENQTGADEILNYCLQTTDNRYSAASFTYNQSGYYQDLNQMLYYNHQKLELLNQTAVQTYLRDINHYTLRLRTQDVTTAPIIDVYVAHLKSSSGSENDRLSMVTNFTDDLTNIPSDHFVIFAGDLNLYTATEPAYVELLDTTNAIVLKDPINRPGSWHNNATFKDIDTQSTHSVSADQYVGGGLDDRFDFILLSENTFNNTHLQYVPSSYHSFGNNGTCFNKSINSNYCSGTEYDQNLRDNLYLMSDHLPVVLTLESQDSNLKIDENDNISSAFIINSSQINENLRINMGKTNTANIKIFNILGQMVLQDNNYHNKHLIDISKLNKGLYLLQIQKVHYTKTLKFVKTD